MILRMEFDASLNLIIFFLHDVEPHDVFLLLDGCEVRVAFLMRTSCGQLIDLQVIWNLQHEMLTKCQLMQN